MATDADRVATTDHSELRWLQRVDAQEPHPRGAIREAVSRGVKFDAAGLLGVADERTETVLICDDRGEETVVVTVLADTIRYFDDERGAA